MKLGPKFLVTQYILFFFFLATLGSRSRSRCRRASRPSKSGGWQWLRITMTRRPWVMARLRQPSRAWSRHIQYTFSPAAFSFLYRKDSYTRNRPPRDVCRNSSGCTGSVGQNQAVSQGSAAGAGWAQEDPLWSLSPSLCLPQDSGTNTQPQETLKHTCFPLQGASVPGALLRPPQTTNSMPTGVSQTEEVPCWGPVMTLSTSCP